MLDKFKLLTRGERFEGILGSKAVCFLCNSSAKQAMVLLIFMSILECLAYDLCKFQVHTLRIMYFMKVQTTKKPDFS